MISSLLSTPLVSAVFVVAWVNLVFAPAGHCCRHICVWLYLFYGTRYFYSASALKFFRTRSTIVGAKVGIRGARILHHKNINKED